MTPRTGSKMKNKHYLTTTQKTILMKSFKASREAKEKWVLLLNDFIEMQRLNDYLGLWDDIKRFANSYAHVAETKQDEINSWR